MNKLNAVDQAMLTRGLALLKQTQFKVSGMVPGAVQDPSERPSPEQVRTYFLALAVELYELMNEFPAWKPWKEPKPVDRDRVIDEFADILAFLGLILYYIETLGIDMVDLAEGYAKKTNVNVSRFNGEVDGYRVQG